MLLRGGFPPDPRVRKEARALLAAGHEVRLLCRGSDRPARERIDGIEVHRIGETLPLDGVGDAAAAASYLATGVHPDWRCALSDLLASFTIDAIHVHDLPLYRTAARVAADRPVVLDLHENYPAAVAQWYADESLTDLLANPRNLAKRSCFPQWRYRRIQRAALAEADHVLAVVAEAREAYLDQGGRPERTTVVSNTVDVEWFDERSRAVSVGRPADGPTLSYVGTLSGPHRGVDLAIRALPTIRETVPDARLRIVGDGERGDHLRRLAADAGVADAVSFVGWVDPETIPAHIAAADVGVVPHRSNEHTETTVPHKLFQYMAAELPTLVTDVAPLARIVTETDSGRVAEANDPDALAAAAIELLAEQTAARLGANGRAAVESEYGWDRDAARLRDVYAEL